MVGQSSRLDLHRVRVDPVIQVGGDCDPVAVDVLATPGLYPPLVTSGLGFFLGGEAANPPGLADSSCGVFDANHVRPGVTAFHDAIPEPGSVLVRLVPVRFGHQAAVLSASSLEM